MRFLTLAAFALASALVTTIAPAQDKAPDAPAEASPPKLDPKACADRERLVEGDTHGTQGVAPRAPLSDRLARTDGVICPPPGLDPDIRIPVPDAGHLKVIPPPGDPDVRPK